MRIKALIIIPALILAACSNNSNSNKLPIYGNRDAVTKTVNGQQVTDTVYHTIAPVNNFVNQYGDTVNDETLRNKIYVADFFFTSCPSICPVMHRNMLGVYSAVKTMDDVKIISYTIDPKHDSVDVLKKHADALGIAGSTWWLLQGDKDATYQLSKSYLVTTPHEDEKEKFVHDGYFILVDKQSHIRGMYQGTDEKEVKQLIEDIKTLRTEPEQTAAK